jgi:hypothetical protein
VLTNDQCKRLKEAGCPGIRLISRGDFNEYTSPTVEEMMGWIGKQHLDWDVMLAQRTIKDKIIYRAGVGIGGMSPESDWFPDALSALYDLFEKLEAK